MAKVNFYGHLVHVPREGDMGKPFKMTIEIEAENLADAQAQAKRFEEDMHLKCHAFGRSNDWGE